MARATARAPIDQPAALNVPLFRQLVDELDASVHRVVLDLGAASTPMLEILGRCPCRVEIADIASFDGIERLNAEAAAEEIAAIAASLLPRHNPDRDIDLVFCWDLLNYLNQSAISALMNTIAARARPGTRVHALIVYSERSMPDRPGRYVPEEDKKLINHAASAPEIPAPRYSPELLGRIMGSFAIEHARLLANGMQEFLFRLRR
jgi:hypothetical protein